MISPLKKIKVFLSSYTDLVAPDGPAEQPMIAIGFLSKGLPFTLETQSIMFLSGPDTDKLYSGHPNKTASAAVI